MGLGGVALGTVLGTVLGAASYELSLGGRTSDSGLAHAAPSRRPSPPAGFSRFEKLESLARALTLLEREYVLPVDGEALIEAALQGMTGRLDPHTSYLPADEAKMLLEDIDGRFGGVGIVVSMRTLESGKIALEIMEVLDGGPAMRAGVQVGDRLVAIEGRDIAEYVDLFEAVRTMRGPVGTEVTFELQGEGGDVREVALTRARIESNPVSVTRRDDGVGVIALRDFQDGAAEAVRGALDELRAGRRGGVAGVVLDLRDNGGGLLDEAIGVVDVFVSRGVIVRTRGRGGRLVSEARASGPRTVRKLPLVVLINKGSASASEIVAAALQDHQRALVVGERSYGKGSVQSPVRLPNGGILKLTTALYYSPNDRVIQAMGVMPDRAVDTLEGEVVDSRPGLVTEDAVAQHVNPAALDEDLHGGNGLVSPSEPAEPTQAPATEEARAAARAQLEALEARQLEVAAQEVLRVAAGGGR